MLPRPGLPPRETRGRLHPGQPYHHEADCPAMCHPGDPAGLDALHDGNEARPGARDDQRFAGGSADVSRERDLGDPRSLPQPVPEPGFRSQLYASDVAHARVSQHQLTEPDSMKRLLVTYTTMAGSTEEVAHALREEIARAGVKADILPIGEVRSLEGYDGLVIGAPMVL